MPRPRSRPAPRSPHRAEAQRGQALALFAISLMALLVGTGLVIDGGFAFVHRRDAQNAADLGALAGTQVIADFHIAGGQSAAQVWGAIDARVRDNGCLPSGSVPCTWSARYIKPASGGGDQILGAVPASGAIPSDAQGVEVTIDSHPPTFFLPLIGRGDWDVGSVAAAIAASMSEEVGSGILLPIGVDPRGLPDNTFQENVPYLLNLDKDGPGNFSWLTWFGPHNAGELADNICTPRNPAYTFPVWIDGDNGKSNSSAMRDCLAKYLGQTILLPLWDDYQGNGSHAQYHIIGVAAFVLQSFGNPAIDEIVGTFKSIYSWTGVPADLGAPPCDPATDASCTSQSFFMGLVR